jgi:hypothetical protein
MIWPFSRSPRRNPRPGHRSAARTSFGNRARLHLEGLEDRLLLSGPQIVDNGTPGYSETGIWTTETVPAYGGNERYATSSGTGQNTATWQAQGLTSGFYQVAVSWHPYPNQATNAPYAIYDGSTLLQTVAVNQTLAASGPIMGGVPFQTLANVNITSGTLKVVLSNTGGGTYMVADAMSETPVSLSSTDLNWAGTGDGITGPTSVNVQTNFTINRTYTISGAAAPGSFTITYYASTSANPNQDLSKATLLGSETLSAAADLAVGNHSGASPAFQFTTGGSYYLLAKLTSGNSFVESDALNDTNNVAVTAQASSVVGPLTSDNGVPGYSETGTWTTETVPAYGGTDRYAASSGTGQNTATWQATGLASGLYQVQATWHPYGNQATNAPYAIYDGATLLQTVSVDQTKAASGPSFGGVPFQVLATVPIKSGTLRVVLSNTGNGTYVIADAVRFVPIPLSNTDLNWSATGDGISSPSGVVIAPTPVTITRTYSISGAPAPGPVTISYYASTSSSLSQNLSQATLVGSETLTAAADLTMGNHSGPSPALQLLTGGTYYLLAALTADPSWVESDAVNDTNNVAASAQTVQVSGPVIVDNGTAGYSETGTWATETVNAYGGSERYATSSGTGQNTATWQVTGLPAGRYQVQVTWHAYGNEASNAPYAIYDGSTLLQTVTVNQTQAASGASFGGVPFQTLATLNITSGTLKVVLSNTGNNTYVVADAVRVVPVLLSTSDLNFTAAGDGISGAPTSVSVWSTFTVTRTYTISTAAAPAKFTIAYYASTSSNVNQNFSQATLMATETLSSAADLAVGNHTGTSPALQVPNSGAYYLFAVLTADPSWAESDFSNDTNNVAVTAAAVQGTGAFIVDNGGPGFSTRGTWKTESVPSHGGTEVYAASSGTGTGTTATWTFTGLTPGQYQVLVTWHPYYNEPTNAPYTIFDKNKALQTVLVDQTQAPTGLSNGGVQFQVLATVTITSSRLKVRLGNTGNGTWVVADAIAVVPM